MRQGHPSRFFFIHHGRSNLDHLSKACFKLCKSITQHQPVSRAVRLGRAIHAKGLKLGISSKCPLGNAILDLYSKSGDISSARNAFDHLKTKDVFAWNSILSMHSKNDLVVHSFVSLLSSQIARPNAFSFAMVLSASSRLADSNLGKQIHCCVLKAGFDSDPHCEAAFIDMYAKTTHESSGEARRAFAGAKNTSIVSWTAIISSHVRSGSFDRAIEAFTAMKRSGIEPDRVAFTSVLSAFVGSGKLDRARQVFDEMPSRSVVAWNLMISGFARAGRGAEALCFFARMRICGFEPTRSTLGSVLSAVANLQALGFGSTVHGDAVKRGLDSNFYVGSSLINLYAKCERVEDSRRVFDGLNRRNDNVVLWNAMLAGYARNRYASEAIELFEDMKGLGVCPDGFTYTSVLSACSCLEALGLGREIHAVVVKNELSSDLFVSNALIDMYTKSGAIANARRHFDRMRKRDKVSWNAIIVGYVQDKDETMAFDMFRKMMFGGFYPDEVSLASLLSGSANTKMLDHGRQIHCVSIKSGLEMSLYAGSSLVDMYAKCGKIESARKVFDFMPNRGVVSMNVLIAGYAQINLGEAVRLLREMQAVGLRPSDITFASLLDGCDGTNLSLKIAMQIHGAVSKTGLLLSGDHDFLRVSLLTAYTNSRNKSDAETLFSEFPNPKSKILWTSMVSGLTELGYPDKALSLYRVMRNENIQLDQATFVSVLRACSHISSLSDGKSIHAGVFVTGFDRDEMTSSALIDMYAKCGDVQSFVSVFQQMTTKNDVISWNSMIVALAKNGLADDAIAVFDDMKRASNIIPDDVTYLGVLTACSHGGRVDVGRRIFETMRIVPRGDHVACVVDLLGRYGLLEEAEGLAERSGFGSDPMVWASILGSSRLYGDESRARRAAERLAVVDPMSSSPYVLLSNVYAASGDWKRADLVRGEMRKRGVEKNPGRSWVVVGRSTHVFVAGDESHSDDGQIRNVLKCLNGLMRDVGDSSFAGDVVQG